MGSNNQYLFGNSLSLQLQGDEYLRAFLELHVLQRLDLPINEFGSYCPNHVLSRLADRCCGGSLTNLLLIVS